MEVYDENGCELCHKCGGEMEGVYDEKTGANERICKECGYTILDGFGKI